MNNMKTEILSFINKYFEEYFIKRDYDGVKECLSSELIAIGTGLNEFASSPNESIELFKKDLNEVKKPIKYTNLRININFSTLEFAVVSGDFTISGEASGINFEIPTVRYSFTLKKENSDWKILHLHMSTPNDQQEDDELYPLQKLVAQNELLNKKVDERTSELKKINTKLESIINTREKLFSIISHDIRSPFNGLLGFIDLLDKKYDEYDSAKTKKIISLINISSNRIFDLVDKLLVWSKANRHGFNLNLKPVNLYSIIQNSIEIFNESIIEKNIIIKNEIPNSLYVQSDEFMLSTIIRNLLSNAIKYSEIDGQVIIKCNEEKTTEEGVVNIGIEDTGIGIEESIITKILESDIVDSKEGTNNEKGTGLGLSICKEFIGLHGFSLNINSKPGIGTAVDFNLKTI